MAGSPVRVAAVLTGFLLAAAAGLWALNEEDRVRAPASPPVEPDQGPDQARPVDGPSRFPPTDVVPMTDPSPGPAPGPAPTPEAAPREVPAAPRKAPHAKSISGRVVNLRGQVPAATNVIARPTDGRGPAPVIPVARDGTFVSDALESNSYDLTARTASGLDCGSATGVTAGSRDLRLVIQSQAEISGTVVDPDGNPAKEGILVVAEAFDRAWNAPGRRSTAWTEADGSFRIQFLKDFEYQVFAPAVHGGTPGSNFAGTPSVKGIRIGRGDVRLRLERPVTISGTLLGPDGRPFGKGGIRAWQDRPDREAVGRVKPDGTFSIGGLLPGKARIQHHFPHRWKPVAEVDAPAADLRLTVSPD